MSRWRSGLRMPPHCQPKCWLFYHIIKGRAKGIVILNQDKRRNRLGAKWQQDEPREVKFETCGFLT